MKRKKILAVTGIRSEYDILYPVINALRNSEEFEVSLVVSGAHLSDFHGYTFESIKKDGFQIADCIDSLFMTNRTVQRSKGVGILVYALSQTVEREKPDFLLVVGDREESIATAIVGNYLNVITAHIGGGDPVWGNITDGKYVVLVKHSLSSEHDEAYSQMKITLEALDEFANKNNFKIVASYPNTDPGSMEILDAVKEYENNKNFKFNKTLPREYFVNLLRNTKVLVGNSSMGILEAPFYRLPVVNVGNRQQGRINAGNLNFVPHDKSKIIEGVEKACFDEVYRSEIKNVNQIYGDGKASEIILKTLLSVNPTDPKYLVKQKLC